MKFKKKSNIPDLPINYDIRNNEFNLYKSRYPPAKLYKTFNEAHLKA